MADEDSDFWTSGITPDFNFVKHNETDFTSFREFSKEIDHLYTSIEIKRAKEERIASLAKWDQSLPDRWKDAKFSLIKKPVVKKIIDALETAPAGSFFLTGGSGVGKTFVAYALLRRFIGHGIVAPAQIKMVSEKELLGFASRGFKGADAFEEVFDRRHKLYLFDGIGGLSDHEAEKVSGLWEQIIDHVFTKDLIAVFTSSDDLDRFVETLSHSSETKIRTLIGDRTFPVEFDGSLARKSKKAKASDTR